MKGREGRLLRRKNAIERLESTIEDYEEILPAERGLLKLMRKEKDLSPDNISIMEKKVKDYEKKLERAKTTLENTKKNLNAWQT